MDEFLGTIRSFPYNFVPRQWMACNGALLSVQQYQALFALLGTYYGGNGSTTFALPDLRGRVAISSGQAPGRSNFVIGQVGGVNSVLLNTTHLPQHTHTLVVSSAPANSVPVAGCLMAATTALQYAPFSGNILSPMAAGAVGTTPVAQSVNITQPSLGLNYCICVSGIFPSRN